MSKLNLDPVWSSLMFVLLITQCTRIAASKPFRFLVGPNRKTYMMHVDLVAAMSDPLERLVNGSMKEAQEEVVDWHEVDEETFVRFCQFAYTGDYKAATPVKLEAQSQENSRVLNSPVNELSREPDPGPEVVIYEPFPPDLPQHTEEEWETFLTPKLKKGKKLHWRNSPTEVHKNWDRLRAMTYSTPVPPAPTGPKKNTSALESYAEVFLCHARLYTFADCYNIESLMLLSLQKLHQQLIVFKLFTGRIGDVVRLIEYSFDNTVDKAGHPDRLRLLLTAYSICKLEKLWGDSEFRNMMEESSDFWKGIIGQKMGGFQLPDLNASRDF